MPKTKFVMPPEWGAKTDEASRIEGWDCEKCGRSFLIWIPFVVGFEPLPEPEDSIEQWVGKVIIQCPDCDMRHWMKVSEDMVELIRESVADLADDRPTLWPTYKDGKPL